MSVKLTPAKIKRIKELSKKKFSQRQIAKKIGCSRSAVFYWLNK